MAITVFLSTVSKEFASYRDRLRGDLTRHNVEVKVQEDFVDLGGETLDKLDTYIAGCDAVVHLIGEMTGAPAPAHAVAAILRKHPDLEAKLPPLAEALAESELISYTQWEAWLALYHGKLLLTAKATTLARRDTEFAPTDESRAAQAAHLGRLEKLERFPGCEFESEADLARHIAYTAILDLLAKEQAGHATALTGVNAQRPWVLICGIAAVAIILLVGFSFIFYQGQSSRQQAQSDIAQLKAILATKNPIAELRAKLTPQIPDLDKVSDEQLPSFVQRLIDGLSKPDVLPPDLADTARRKIEVAQALTSKLEFSNAARVLDDEIAQSNNAALGRAALLAERARVAGFQARYREAADFYSQAAGVSIFVPGAAWLYALRAAEALVIHGREFKDNAALLDAIGRYKNIIASVPHSQRPTDWANTQIHFGFALESLFFRDDRTTWLEEAITAYRAASEVFTLKSAPSVWAETMNSLGRVLLALGERESGTARMEEAVAAYRAIPEWMRDRSPQAWGTTQNNLGLALLRLGEREIGTVRMEEAVAAYRAALAEVTRNRDPLAWAEVQHGLGVALWRLGGRESGTARLEEAVVALRAALTEARRERVPLAWAKVQNNLGLALSKLGERENSTARLKEGIVALRAALAEATRDRVPVSWAISKINLGDALAILGERESGTAQLEDAVVAYHDGLEEIPRDIVPLTWARTQYNLGKALATLGEREGDTAWLEEAVTAYRLALEERTRDHDPLVWAEIQNNLGKALTVLGERLGDPSRLADAVACASDAVEAFRTVGATHDLQIAESTLQSARAALAKRTNPPP